MANRRKGLQSLKEWLNAETLFDKCYGELAEVGLADEPFGREFHRIKQEWNKMGRPKAILAFIIDHAQDSPTI